MKNRIILLFIFFLAITGCVGQKPGVYDPFDENGTTGEVVGFYDGTYSQISDEQKTEPAEKKNSEQKRKVDIKWEHYGEVAEDMIPDFSPQSEFDKFIMNAVKKLVSTLHPKYKKHIFSKYRLAFLDVSDRDKPGIKTNFHQYLTEKTIMFLFLQPDIAENMSIVQRLSVEDAEKNLAADAADDEKVPSAKIRRSHKSRRSDKSKRSDKDKVFRILDTPRKRYTVMPEKTSEKKESTKPEENTTESPKDNNDKKNEDNDYWMIDSIADETLKDYDESVLDEEMNRRVVLDDESLPSQPEQPNQEQSTPDPLEKEEESKNKNVKMYSKQPGNNNYDFKKLGETYDVHIIGTGFITRTKKYVHYNLRMIETKGARIIAIVSVKIDKERIEEVWGEGWDKNLDEKAGINK